MIGREVLRKITVWRTREWRDVGERSRREEEEEEENVGECEGAKSSREGKLN